MLIPNCRDTFGHIIRSSLLRWQKVGWDATRAEEHFSREMGQKMHNQNAKKAQRINIYGSLMWNKSLFGAKGEIQFIVRLFAVKTQAHPHQHFVNCRISVF